MGTQNAQRVVVKWNTCRKNTCNNTQQLGTSNQWPVQQLNGIECMCMSQCL